MRNYVHIKINEMVHANINDDQIWWEILKLAKELIGELQILENKLKLSEQNLKRFENKDYLRCKLRLEAVCETKSNGVKIRSNTIVKSMEKSILSCF